MDNKLNNKEDLITILNNKLSNKEDWITVLYGVAEKMALVALSGDTFAASALDKMLGLAMKLDGTLDESPKDKSLTSAKLMDELKLLNDQLAGRKGKRTLRPRGKPFTRDDPRIQRVLAKPRKTTEPEQIDDIPFSDPPDVSEPTEGGFSEDDPSR